MSGNPRDDDGTAPLDGDEPSGSTAAAVFDDPMTVEPPADDDGPASEDCQNEAEGGFNEMEADENEADADEILAEADESETVTGENEAEADENVAEADENVAEAGENVAEAGENYVEADENNFKDGENDKPEDGGYEKPEEKVSDGPREDVNHTVVENGAIGQLTSDCNEHATDDDDVPLEEVVETDEAVNDSSILVDSTADSVKHLGSDIDSYAIELLKPSCSNGASEFNNIKLVLDKSSFHQDKTASDVRSTKEGGNNRNSVVLNIEMYKEMPGPSSSSETKTNSRPQRQAAKKAESQIREIAKEITKPFDNMDEKIVVMDTVEALSSPLKKVCCQCNRFRLCKFTVKGNKAMYLCQEECVTNYRWKSGLWNPERKCEQCLTVISENSDRSYCWQVKHFCSIDCLSNYQSLIFDSNCTNCHKVIKSNADFGKYCRYICGKILQFCGYICSESYENKLSLCSFCQKEFYDSDYKEFCSSYCQTKDYKARKKHIEPVSSVDGSNKTTVDKCNICFCKLNSLSLNQIQIFNNTNTLCKFCSNECLNKYLVSKKRTVSCCVCKIKKFSFDMISTKNASTTSPTYICSLNCVQKQYDIPKSKKAPCDRCGLPSLARHKTVHNESSYNFCSQNCSNSFQSPKKRKSTYKYEKQSSSRASTRRNVRKEENISSDSDKAAHSFPQKSKRKYNVSKKMNNRNSNVIPKVDKEVQTDLTGNKSVIIPVPVPVYIPMPMHMFVRPYPVPVPFPIPLPIPIFIPTTKNTTKSILKDIQKIKDETPADPFEAELLLMAGMVADVKKNENTSSSDSELDSSSNGDFNDDSKVVSSSAHNHNSFGDDVLAMAFNMAGADAESIEGSDDIPTMTSSNQENQIIDDVEANLVTSTIMPQTPDPTENITQENMISSPQEILRRPPRKRAPRSQSQRSSNCKRSRKNEYPQSQCVQTPAGLLQQSQQQVVQNPLYSFSMSGAKPDQNLRLKYTYGVIAWRQWASAKSIEFEKTLSSSVLPVKKTNIFKLDLLQLTASELNYCLDMFVKESRKPNGSEYAPDTIYYFCLGIQQYLFQNGRIDNIFTDVAFDKFTNTLNEIAIQFTKISIENKFVVTRVEEEYLWESKQLGAHSPYVLLCTLIFFNTKHFNLTTVEEHMQLSFSHIMKHWKRNPNQPSTSGAKAPGTYRNVLLRFYPPQAALDSPNSRKKKVYEQHENEEDPLRCPVKLYEFYISKCPESVKTRNDLFYLTPERSCVPDSPVWYSTGPLNKEPLEKMLNRVKMIKEINLALLHS